MKARVLITITMITALFAGLATEVAAITNKEYAVIMNLSGRQRMLSQKMSKEMLLVAAGVDAAKNRGELKKTANLFDKTLEGLINGSKELGLPPTTSKGTLRQLNKVSKLWSEFKSTVDSVAGGGSVPIGKVAGLNLPLLKNSNTAVRLYEKEAKKATGKSAGTVINLAGKQRMLTQKMSKEMLLVFLNHETEKNKGAMKSTSTLFDRTLKGLRDGDKDMDLPGTTDSAIVAQLDKVRALWGKFKPIAAKVTDIDAKGVSMDDLKKMAELNLPLLKEMNKAVKMYEVAQK